MIRVLLVRICWLLALCPQQGGAQVIERWNEEFLATVRRQAMPPCVVARNLAILHLAMWRAIDEAHPQGNPDVTAAAAAHRVCVTLFAGDRAGFDRLIADFHGKPRESFAAGLRSADQMLAERENDGSTTTVHYHPQLAPGVWQRTTRNREPELPHWGKVRPFVLASGDQFRPPPPPAPTSAAYAEMLDEVRTLGGATSADRIKDQEEVARFWSDFSYTTSPAGRWNEIACLAIKDSEMQLRERARLFAILNVALADAGIAAWDCKYHYRYWRPVSAIREIIDDGNDATSPDREWKSLLPAPSHPEYVSGHSTFSGAASTILSRMLGVPEKPIVVRNRDMPGVTRSFRTFDEIATEAGRSRIYGGIHFSPANVEGCELGRKVAERVLDRFPQ